VPLQAMSGSGPKANLKFRMLHVCSTLNSGH
jgi:hypothetical protein